MSLITKTATEILELLRREEVSPIELLDALEQRIAEVEPELNALPTLCFDRAREHARELMKKPIAQRGLLAGLPVAIKDLDAVAGVRTTFGSQIYSDFIPESSDIMVDTLERNGGLVYAKTNTPEFGAGANTFNEVFGKTVNPWNTAMSCAGSSGGSAVALASGTAWLATGSDLGGSLRNPASFCSIVGFRPSPGRVANGSAGPGAYPSDLGGMPTQPFAVSGPMARTVSDVALMLDAMSGCHPHSMLSFAGGSETFVAALNRPEKALRVAYSPDFGITPVDPEVAELTRKAADRFKALGCTVEEAHPDFSDVQDIFQTNRAISFYISQKELLKTRRSDLKPEVVWNIEKASNLTVDDLARVEMKRGAYLARAAAFFDDFDLLLSPATIVPPYPVEQRYVESCGDITFDNYIEWCTIAYAITVAGFPAMSVPAGFTSQGLPVGLQMVTAHRQEAALLHAARRFEEVATLDEHTPITPRSHS